MSEMSLSASYATPVPITAPVRSTGEVLPLRIELTDPSCSDALRSYFLRLGAVAVSGDDGSVDAYFPVDDLNEDMDVASCLHNWVGVNGVGAHVVGAVAEPIAPAPPAAAFEVLPRATQLRPAPPRLGDLLVSKGYITVGQLAAALVESKQSGELLGRILLQNRWVFEPDLARTLSEQWGLPYINISLIGVDHRALRLLPREVGLSFAAIPVRYLDGTVQVAFADPSDATAVAAVREHITSIELAVAEFSDIASAWRTAVSV